MNKYITEFIGTFFLVLIIGITNNPIAIGIGLSVLVYMGAHISGAHYNPVVSLAMFIQKEINKSELLYYIISQLIASLAATFVVQNFDINSFEVIANTSNRASFLLAEILFTFLLVFVILNVLLSPSNKFSNVFNFSSSPKVNPEKLSLNISSTVREKVVTPTFALVKIPA